MSAKEGGMARSEAIPLLWRLGEWIAAGKRLAYVYRPRLEDRRFWMVQGLVLLVAGTHAGIEVSGVLDSSRSYAHGLAFLPVSLLFIPVVYAALNFGFTGSVTTALWCTALGIPNVVLFHEGSARVGEVVQLGIIGAIAVFVGQRVDKEMAARTSAEAASAACLASEAKYRGLFETSAIPIVVFDANGVVQEANPAADTLFGKPPKGLRGSSAADLIGKAEARKFLDPATSQERTDGLRLRVAGGREAHVEPSIARSTDLSGNLITQVLLYDVTQERHRQAGFRAYAARILHAQEEERRRIAAELHDDAVQELVLLCRQLDAVEAAATPLQPSLQDGLREARKSAEHVASGLRVYAKALRPPSLDDLGLVTSLRWALLDVSNRAQIQTGFRVLGRERLLGPDVSLALFRIAQEALRNVERHAHAAHVTLTVFFTESEVVLEIEDDGVGFIVPHSSADFASGGQLGLLGMQERAELAGGRLNVYSSPGHGTRVTVSVATNR